MSKKNVNQLVIDQDEMSESKVETLLSKAIGRKRSGTVRIQYIHSSSTYGERIRTLASIISYKFYREMTSIEHMVDDRPMVDDLIGADLPWTGLVQCKDEVMDERYCSIMSMLSMFTKFQNSSSNSKAKIHKFQYNFKENR